MAEIERVTSRDVIRSVAKMWKEQYCHNGQWLDTLSGSSKAVHRKLLALDANTASAEDVKAIIGNDSWTELACDVCEREVEEVFTIESRYGDYSVNACRKCLKHALAQRPSKENKP